MPPRLHAMRRRRRAWGLALGTLLHGGQAMAAAFLPGAQEADPPTGDNIVALPQEPLAAGSGIRWTIAPWRWRGSLTLDGRALRQDDARRALSGLALADFEFGSYVWQPWFIQLRAGLGLLFGGDRTAGGQDMSSSGRSIAGSGRFSLSVFPASRFPFELRADLGDTRAGGETLVSHYRTLRLSLSQAYRPPTGNDSYSLNLDYSRLRGDDKVSDALTLLNAQAVQRWGEHHVDLGLTFSDNRRSGSDDASRLVNGTARHVWQPAPSLLTESMAHWSDLRLRAGRGASRLATSSQVLQLSTLASWRPREGDVLYDPDAPLTVAASARLLDAVSGDAPHARSLSAVVGVAKQFTPQWRASAATSLSHFDTGAGQAQTLGAFNGSLLYTPESRNFGDWRWSPTASASLGLNRTVDGASRQLAGLQASHALSRSWPLDANQVLGFNVAQSAALLKESPAGTLTSGLAHSAGLYWQASGDNGSQTLASLAASDSRNRGTGAGRFQFVNLQLSRRTQLARWSSWSANLTLQATRNDLELLDPFTGIVRSDSQGWAQYHQGSLSFESQRAFGVPRLRFTLLASVASQQLEQRSAGDLDAPLERVSQSLEARLEYTIGRLDTRLSARLARVDERTVAALQARAQRRF